VLRARRLWLAVASVAVVCVGGYTLWYRKTYDNWPSQGAPARLQWCGRDYLRDDPEVRGDVTRVARYRLFRAPPVIGHFAFTRASGTERRHSAEVGDACDTLLYLRTGDHSYAVYTLSGGP
jgi:hypothetical protein